MHESHNQLQGYNISLAHTVMHNTMATQNVTITRFKDDQEYMHSCYYITMITQ